MRPWITLRWMLVAVTATRLMGAEALESLGTAAQADLKQALAELAAEKSRWPGC